MKHILLRPLFLSIALVLYNAFSFSGFIASTLISTPTQQIAIEHLAVNYLVTSYDNSIPSNSYTITKISHYTSSYCIKITIQDTTIITTPDQQFYSPTKQTWVAAKTLMPKDSLLCCNGRIINISAIQQVDQPVNMYGLLVDGSHTFCVSPYEIVVHNGEPATIVATTALAIAFPPAAPVILTVQAIIGSALAGIGCYYVYKKHQQNNTLKQIQEEVRNASNAAGSPKKPDNDDENDEDEHPHGIYKDADYHHKNSTGDKSPPPKDGQRCLDYSLPYTDRQRIGIEENTFVLLKQTLPRLFHGHLIPWNKIKQKTQVILQKSDYVSSSGRIIKQIITKALR